MSRRIRLASSLSELTSCRLLVMIASGPRLLQPPDGLGNAVGDFIGDGAGAAVLVFQPFTFQTNVPSAPPIGGRFLTNYALTNQGRRMPTARPSAACSSLLIR